YALASSGLLVRKIGGPSVKPYQPEGVWEAVAMIGSNTRDYKRDSGESLYRRSLYTFWKRAAPPASMDILNAPNRETCTVRRERTNTPLQALVTLNDPQFVEAARHLAESALRDGGRGAGAWGAWTIVANELMNLDEVLNKSSPASRGREPPESPGAHAPGSPAAAEPPPCTRSTTTSAPNPAGSSSPPPGSPSAPPRSPPSSAPAGPRPPAARPASAPPSPRRTSRP